VPITPAEFEALYRSHAGEVLGFLRRRGPAADAEDLLAEVFLVAWRRRADLPDAVARRAWLFGTARRLLLAAHRGRVGGAGPLDDVSAADVEAADHGTVGADRRGAAVRAALASLAEVDRELLLLTVWDGLTVAEASEVVGLLPGAGRVRLHRARRRLAADPTLVDLLPSPAPL